MTQTSTSSSSAPVVIEILVDAPQEFAFKVFTKQGTWWPMESHHIASTPAIDVIVEPKAGGRWYERDANGNECIWGDVLAYEPFSRIVLGWHLNSKWEYDAGFLNEVEVRFQEEGPEKTRVTLEHRNLERFGEDVERVRKALDSENGWGGILKLYASQANSEAATL